MEKKLNIFIDAGSNKGQSIDHFLKSEECLQFGGKDSWLIYAFEPHPHFEKYFKHRKSVVYIKMAVWTENCDILFYINNSNVESQGCSLMSGKTSGNLDKENPIIVRAFDFSSWIIKNFNNDKDNIVIRMDIEGAEYKVLQSMIDSGSIKSINHLIVEMHQHKMSNISFEEHDKLVASLKDISSLKLDILNEYY
jgi:FkbM family methyltransferase